MGCYSVNSAESIEVPEDLTVDEQIEMAKAVVDSLWSGGLRKDIHEQFPELTKFELLGFRLNWRVARFKPLRGEDRTAHTTVTIVCTMRQKFRFSLGRPVAAYCRDRVEEALAARSVVELDSALYEPAVAYIRKLFPGTEVLLYPQTMESVERSFGPLPPGVGLGNITDLKDFAGEGLAEGFGSDFQSAPLPRCGHMLSTTDATLVETHPTEMLGHLRRMYDKVIVVQFSTPKVDPAGSALLYYELRDPDVGWAGNVLKLSREESGWKVDGQLTLAFS